MGAGLSDRFAEEQAVLRRMAALVAAPPETVFAAVAEEVGRLLGVDPTVMGRYDPGDTVTSVGAWTGTGTAVPIPNSQACLGAELGGLDEQREIARGLHPALAEGGLRRRSSRSPAAPPSPSASTCRRTHGFPSRSSSPPTTSSPRRSPTPPSTRTPPSSTSMRTPTKRCCGFVSATTAAASRPRRRLRPGRAHLPGRGTQRPRLAAEPTRRGHGTAGGPSAHRAAWPGTRKLAASSPSAVIAPLPHADVPTQNNACCRTRTVLSRARGGARSHPCLGRLARVDPPRPSCWPRRRRDSPSCRESGRIRSASAPSGSRVGSCSSAAVSATRCPTTASATDSTSARASRKAAPTVGSSRDTGPVTSSSSTGSSARSRGGDPTPSGRPRSPRTGSVLLDRPAGRVPGWCQGRGGGVHLGTHCAHFLGRRR
jgi:hypothetical protein